MNDEIKRKFLIYLKGSNKALSSDECAEVLGVSRRKLVDEIKQFNGDLMQNGAVIISKSGRGNGYSLIINSEEKFEQYLNGLLINKSNTFIDKQDRVEYLIRLFLNSKSYIKQDDLCQKLAVSLTQLKTDLNEVKKEFKKFNIEIVSRPHYGMMIQGDEVNIRQCLASRLNKVTKNGVKVMSGNDEIEKGLEDIRKIIIERSLDYDYELNDMVLNNLISHLYVSLQRSLANKKVTFTDEVRKQIESEKEFSLAKAIIKDIGNEFNITLPKEEIYYCTIHLCGKKTIEGNYIFDDDLVECIDEIIESIRKKYMFNFRGDLNLKMMLGLHIIPLLSRIKYNLKLENPLIGEIKEKFLVAYELSVLAGEVINRRYGCNLSEDEIGYLALHFKLAMSDYMNDKKRVLIVCSTGRGSAKLLESQFLEYFGQSIGKLTVCNVFELDSIDYSEYDCIFSTVNINKKLPLPVIKISHFVSSDDNKDLIRKYLMKEELYEKCINVFDECLFISCLRAVSKEQVIEDMVNKLNKHRDIPNGFYENVLERERMADTNLAANVAMPHPMNIMTRETFVSVAILEKPIEWTEGQNVQVVFLCSFEKGFARENTDFFDFFSKLIGSKKMIDKLIRKPEYETLRRLIEQICCSDGKGE